MAVHQYNFSPAGPVLQEFYDCQSKAVFITGPVGSSKTTTLCYKMLRKMIEQSPNHRNIRPTRSIVIRRTYKELLKTTAKDFLSIFGDLGTFKQGTKEPPTFFMRFKVYGGDGRWDGTVVEHEMMFIALDRPNSAEDLRGFQVTWFWLSEAKQIRKSIVDMADDRCGRYPSGQLGNVMPTWHGFFGDTNQCDEDHWLYNFQEVLKPAGELPNWEFFVQPGGVVKISGKWVENPEAENLDNLVPNYYQERIQGKSEDKIKVDYANQYGYVMSGKPVHPEYNDHVHCCDDVTPRADLTLVLGFDFGRTPACAIMQEIGETWYVLDEFVSVDMSASKFGPALKRYLASNYAGFACVGHGDPAGKNKGEQVEHSAIEILNALGIPCEPCETNDPLQRRAAIATPLTELGMSGKPRLMICKKAKMIRKGLAGKFTYRRLQVAGDDKYMDKPDKNAWSHPVEACEYGLMGEGEGVEAIISAANKINSNDTLSKTDYYY